MSMVTHSRASDCSQLEMTNQRRCRCSFSAPFDKMPAGVWVQACCRHICYGSTLISAGPGLHRSAMTAPVNVWITEDTSYCQQEQATISNVYQFGQFLFFNFFLAPAGQELCSHLSYEFTSECKQLCFVLDR